MKALDNKLPPPLVAGVMALVMGSAARVLPPLPLAIPLHFALTAFCGLVALTVAGSAIVAFRRARTTVNPIRIETASRLVTSGIFRYTRNPMYLGAVAGLLGWAVWLAVPWTALGPVLFAAFIQRFQILPEERVLSAKFGADFENYRRRVRRWL